MLRCASTLCSYPRQVEAVALATGASGVCAMCSRGGRVRGRVDVQHVCKPHVQAFVGETRGGMQKGMRSPDISYQTERVYTVCMYTLLMYTSPPKYSSRRPSFAAAAACVSPSSACACAICVASSTGVSRTSSVRRPMATCGSQSSTAFRRAAASRWSGSFPSAYSAMKRLYACTACPSNSARRACRSSAREAVGPVKLSTSVVKLQ